MNRPVAADAALLTVASELQREFHWSAAERDAFLEALHQPPPLAIRLQRGTQRDQLPYQLNRVPWHDSAFWWRDGIRPGQTLSFAGGQYYIQDAGSLLAIALLDPQPGEAIADLCAAPGGKATAILDAIGRHGWLLAHEAIRSRQAPLQLNLARQGSARYVLSTGDVDHLPDDLAGLFDAVLVDVPCSGQSLVGRGKQRKSAFDRDSVSFNAARQARILDAAAAFVQPGGRLVYATCTFSTEENEAQIEHFLERHSEWKLEPVGHLAPWQSPRLPATYRLWPHRDQVAGAFAACLRHHAGGSAASPRPWRSSTDLPSALGAWGELKPALCWQDHHVWYAVASKLPAQLESLPLAGPEVAHRRGRSWFPSYALAMRCRDDWQPHQVVDLSLEDAAAYVRGEELRDVPDGWSVAQWHGLALGWLKGSHGRGKNHLPKPARIAAAQGSLPGGSGQNPPSGSSKLPSSNPPSSRISS